MAQRPVERAPPNGPLEAVARAAPGAPAGRGTSGPDRAVACDGNPVPSARRAPLPAPDTGALRERGPRPPLGSRRDQLSPVESDAGTSAPASAAGASASGVSSGAAASGAAASGAAAAVLSAG